MRSQASRSPEPSSKDILASQSLIKTKYSNIPINVPVLLPSFVRAKAATINCLNGQILREMIERDSANKHRSRYQEIKKTDPQDAIGVIINDTKKLVNSAAAKKKKGSMFISELWGNKHLKDVIKVSRLDKAYESIQKAETEGLKEKLEKLEKVYEMRDSRSEAADSNKILEEFMSKGLNSPRLKTSRNISPKGETKFVGSTTSIAELHGLEKNSEKKSRQNRPGSLEVSLSTVDYLVKIHSPKSLKKLNNCPSFSQASTNNTDLRSEKRRITCDPPARRDIRVSSLSYLKDLTNDPESNKSIRSSLTGFGSLSVIKTNKSPKKLLSPIMKSEDLNKLTDQTYLRSPSILATRTSKSPTVPPINVDIFAVMMKDRNGLGRTRAISTQNLLNKEI